MGIAGSALESYACYLADHRARHTSILKVASRYCLFRVIRALRVSLTVFVYARWCRSISCVMSGIRQGESRPDKKRG